MRQSNPEGNKRLDYITKSMQLNLFSRKAIQEATSETLRYRRNTQKVYNDNEVSTKFYLPYQRGVEEKI